MNIFISPKQAVNAAIVVTKLHSHKTEFV